MKWFVAQYRDGIKRLLPDRIPCKENLAFLGAELIRNTSDADAVLGATLEDRHRRAPGRRRHVGGRRVAGRPDEVPQVLPA